jgi:hypothetical protein
LRWPFVCIVLGTLSFHIAAQAAPEPAVLERLDVAPVWSGHPVGFCLLTHGTSQYVAYYDQNRQLTVAQRSVGSRQWRFVPLRPSPAVATGQRDPTVIGWDSHNYVAMAMDAEGQLHLSGNMHVNPLLYFRTTRAGDASSFVQVAHMVGEREERCTYPRFVRGAAGELIFAYRDGRSGSGDDIYNVFDVASHAWRRLIDTPLTNGMGKMNAYSVGPVKGPDGYFHLCWVWRDSPDCSSNHDLCYARSRDMVHWETSGGKALALPIALASSEVVDPVPAKGGIINGNTAIGFDSAGRVVLSYHKFDADGYTQIYNARREAAGWKIVQASEGWTYRWEVEDRAGERGVDVSVGVLRGRVDPEGDRGERGAGDRGGEAGADLASSAVWRGRVDAGRGDAEGGGEVCASGVAAAGAGEGGVGGGGDAGEVGGGRRGSADRWLAVRAAVGDATAEPGPAAGGGAAGAEHAAGVSGRGGCRDGIGGD